MPNFTFKNCDYKDLLTELKMQGITIDAAINSERDFRKIQQKIPNKIKNSLQMIA